jgi:hypothetical protein
LTANEKLQRDIKSKDELITQIQENNERIVKRLKRDSVALEQKNK